MIAEPTREAPRAQFRFLRKREPDKIGARLNKLRAGVLGANDGIVSVAATVIGVAAATPDNLLAIATAGFASVSAGAFSMAVGEYVSVSAQRDTENSIISKARRGAGSDSLGLMTRLAEDLKDYGVEAPLAERVAAEMYAHDPIRSASRVHGIDSDDIVNPWAAALASLVAFILGSALPIAAILLFPMGFRIPATFVSILVALVLTGFISARMGDAHPGRAAARTVIGGAIAMAATYLVGLLFNVGMS
ncbi:MAG TPA: VIT family protein [Actinomycetaceae bacterium]|nr:VIT family protein [Actinomycetaceae bacterium]